MRDLREPSRVGDGVAVFSVVKALVAVADPVAAGQIARALDAANLVATLAFSASRAVQYLALDHYDVLVLDLELWRQDAGAPPFLIDIPVVTMGAETAGSPVPFAREHHVAEAGGVAEIVAVVVALAHMTRRVRLPHPIRWAGLELDVQRREARWQGTPIHLTVIQFRILEVLALAAGTVVPTSTLARRVWGTESFDDQERLLAHIRRIRKKVEALPSQPRFVLTVRGEGFRLADDADVSELTAAPHAGEGIGAPGFGMPTA